jgi:hypothetical protein
VCRRRLIALTASLLLCNFVQAEIIDGEEFIDPTQPLTALRAEDGAANLSALFRNIVPASYDLTFIRAGNTNPIAVINNQRVTIGDVISGATVTKISRSTVTLAIEDNEQVIGLYDTSVKRAVLNP